MKYIIGNNRNQMSMFCLEDVIGQDNEVRLIDLLVDGLPKRACPLFFDSKESF